MSKSGDQERLKLLTKTLIPDFKAKVKTIQKELSSMESEAVQLAASLAPKDREEIKISDHALIRYLERKHGFDFTQFRDEILTPDRKIMIEAGVKEINAGGIRLKVDGKTIVTVLS